MNKIYHVMIKGRTLESRNLKELLAKAVSEKRNLDRMSRFQAGSRARTSMSDVGDCFNESGRIAVV
jgi:hypothetical protein